MTQPDKPIQTPDDLLADFTDRVMDGKITAIASSSDQELRGLEETVMRFKRAFPTEPLDEKKLERMQADFKTRIRKESLISSRPAWQSRQFRQRFVLAFAAIAILVAIFMITPFLTSGIGDVQGTAGLQSQSIVLLAILGGVIVLVFWLGRRK